MAKKSTKSSPATPTPFEQARDELFQHIISCGVVGADREHQDEWFTDTLKYFTERYPELSEIGRAACRERAGTDVDAGYFPKNGRTPPTCTEPHPRRRTTPLR